MKTTIDEVRHMVASVARRLNRNTESIAIVVPIDARAGEFMLMQRDAEASTPLLTGGFWAAEWLAEDMPDARRADLYQTIDQWVRRCPERKD